MTNVVSVLAEGEGAADVTGVGGGGGGGGGGGDINEVNASTGDDGSDFVARGDDFSTGSAGVDFDVGNIGDSDLDASSAGGVFGDGGDADAGSVTDGGGGGGKAGLSGIGSNIILRGGECTSTMLSCVWSLPFD